MALRTLALFAAFAAGLACGGAGVWVWLNRPAPAPAVEAPAPAAPLPRSTGILGDGTAWVTLADGLDQRRVPAVVIAGADVLVIRADDFIAADDGWWHGANGVRRLLRGAVAWDLDVGLIAFAVNNADTDGVALTDEDGALFLGRDVVVVDDDRRVDGFVDSAAIAVGPNHYRYELRTGGPIQAALSAIVLPGSGELVGVGVRDASTDGVQAIDAGSLRDLLDVRGTRQPLSLPAWSRYFLSTPHGMAAEFERHVAGSRWQGAVRLASELVATHPERVTDDLRSRARIAAEQLALGYIAAGRPQEALSVIDGALRAFDGGDALLRLARDTLARHGSPERTIAFLAEAAAREGGTPGPARALLRQAVLARANAEDVASGTAIAMLADALALDPDYAPYHRALGARYYEAGRYADAEFHLQRAVRLDPQYAADVDLALRQSRQRRQIDRLVEVPMIDAGGALYVDARLNGSAGTFRFLVDTGASFTAINTATVLQLGLTEIFASGAPLIELETAAGRVFAQSFTLSSIDVAGAVVRDVPVVVLEDMGPLDGLLGLSFLRHFDVDINQREGKLLLAPR